jgi:hypothetical protein
MSKPRMCRSTLIFDRLLAHDFLEIVFDTLEFFERHTVDLTGIVTNVNIIH